jgi:hypothetical protein
LIKTGKKQSSLIFERIGRNADPFFIDYLLLIAFYFHLPIFTKDCLFRPHPNPSPREKELEDYSKIRLS